MCCQANTEGGSLLQVGAGTLLLLFHSAGRSGLQFCWPSTQLSPSAFVLRRGRRCWQLPCCTGFLQGVFRSLNAFSNTKLVSPAWLARSCCSCTLPLPGAGKHRMRGEGRRGG